jgi:hypothetical protein
VLDSSEMVVEVAAHRGRAAPPSAEGECDAAGVLKHQGEGGAESEPSQDVSILDRFRERSEPTDMELAATA